MYKSQLKKRQTKKRRDLARINTKYIFPGWYDLPTAYRDSEMQRTLCLSRHETLIYVLSAATEHEEEEKN